MGVSPSSVTSACCFSFRATREPEFASEVHVKVQDGECFREQIVKVLVFDALVSVSEHPNGWWVSGSYNPLQVDLSWLGSCFTVLMDERFGGEGIKDRAIVNICTDLVKTANRMPLHALQAICEQSILWLNVNNGRKGAETHYSLKEFDPAAQNSIAPKRLAVEINDWDNFLHGNLPRLATLLHEFSHVFHSIIGEDHELIQTLFERAVSSGKYELVQVTWGEPRRAYGLENKAEFFASLSVAYLGGQNDFQPFTLEELRMFDPEALVLLSEIWRCSR